MHLIHAAGSGMTFTLIALPPERRDLALSTLARDAVLASITTDPLVRPQSANGPVASAIALRAALPESSALTDAERTLLTEWLDRLAT